VLSHRSPACSLSAQTRAMEKAIQTSNRAIT
jgi:hypothetical protein